MHYRYVGAVLAMFAAAACSNLTDSTGTAASAGSYQTFFSTTMSAPTINGSATLPQTLGTIALGTPASDGTFSGSFSINSNGGSGTISHFGDPKLSPLQSVAFLETLMPSCDFTQAVSGAMSGAVQNGNLALTGALTLPCSWTDGDSTVVVPTVVTVQVSGSQD